MNRERAEAVLARLRAEREAETARQRAAQAAATLRAFFYPKQAAFFRSTHALKTTTKTRRAGVTTGGCHELLARALLCEGYRAEQGFRAAIIHSTRIEARSRAWKTDTKNGIVDILERYGTLVPGRGVVTYELGGVKVFVRDGESALDFSNGSRIELFGVDSDDDQGKLRGVVKHVYWIDEAQDPRFLDQLAPLYNGTIVPAADFRPEVWITGTPGKDLAGMFYDITRDDGHRMPGWEVHTLSVVDNPYFGASPEERWEETAVRALNANGWTTDHPDFQREWMGKWVRTDARWVYAANEVPIHQLLYAPERFMLDGFPDVKAAMLDLPEIGKGRPYFLAMGNDLGTYAFALHAWSPADPTLYEVASYKRRGLDYDDMFACIIAVRSVVDISLLVGDAGGGGKQAVKGWSKKLVERYGVPMIEATKTNKHTAIDTYNNDVRKGRMKYRGTPEKPSPLLQELLTHRWLPTRSATGNMVEDPSTDNHVCDGSLYAHRESYHHRYRESPVQPARDTPEWIAREERELAEAVISNAEDDYSGW